MESTTKKSRIILAGINLILFAGVLVLNGLASALPINGKDTGELADLYPNLFVPAGITFAIWGIIYLLLLGFVINQLVLAVRSKSSGLLSMVGSRVLGINFLFNMAWILAWHYEMVGLSLLVMLGLLLSLIYLFRETDAFDLPGFASRVLVQIPISVYLGWISVATIANVTSFLVDLNWAGFGLSEVVWTITVIIVGTILALLMLNIRKNLIYAIVVVWAYIGIVIKRMAVEPVETSIIYTVYGVLAILVIYMIIILAGKLRNT
jgi:benzodiazapine receptor